MDLNAPNSLKIGQCVDFKFLIVRNYCKKKLFACHPSPLSMRGLCKAVHDRLKIFTEMREEKGEESYSYLLYGRWFDGDFYFEVNQ